MTDTRDSEAEKIRFDEIVAGGTKPPPSAKAKTGRAWPKWTLLSIVVIGLVAAGMYVVFSQTVMNSTYDNVVSDLDAANAALTATEAENMTLTNELASTTAELEAQTERVASLSSDLDGLAAENATLATDLAAASGDLAAAEASNATLEASIAEAGTAVRGARVAATAGVTNLVFVDSEAYDYFMDIGVPTGLGDRLVEMAGIPHESWESWAGSDDAFFVWGSAIENVNDQALQAAFRTYAAAELNSDEEVAAAVELELRTWLLVLQRLDAASAVFSSSG